MRCGLTRGNSPRSILSRAIRLRSGSSFIWYRRTREQGSCQAREPRYTRRQRGTRVSLPRHRVGNQEAPFNFWRCSGGGNEAGYEKWHAPRTSPRGASGSSSGKLEWGPSRPLRELAKRGACRRTGAEDGDGFDLDEDLGGGERPDLHEGRHREVARE